MEQWAPGSKLPRSCGRHLTARGVAMTRAFLPNAPRRAPRRSYPCPWPTSWPMCSTHVGAEACRGFPWWSASHRTYSPWRPLATCRCRFRARTERSSRRRGSRATRSQRQPLACPCAGRCRAMPQVPSRRASEHKNPWASSLPVKSRTAQHSRRVRACDSGMAAEASWGPCSSESSAAVPRARGPSWSSRARLRTATGHPSPSAILPTCPSAPAMRWLPHRRRTLRTRRRPIARRGADPWI